jgi:hypothetical protein
MADAAQTCVRFCIVVGEQHRLAVPIRPIQYLSRLLNTGFSAR